MLLLHSSMRAYCHVTKEKCLFVGIVNHFCRDLRNMFSLVGKWGVGSFYREVFDWVYHVLELVLNSRFVFIGSDV